MFQHLNLAQRGSFKVQRKKTFMQFVIRAVYYTCEASVLVRTVFLIVMNVVSTLI